MPKVVIMDVFLLTMKVPQRLPAREATAIRRFFTSWRFQAALREAARNVVRAHTSLRHVNVTLSR